MCSSTVGSINQSKFFFEINSHDFFLNVNSNLVHLATSVCLVGCLLFQNRVRTILALLEFFLVVFLRAVVGPDHISTLIGGLIELLLLIKINVYLFK